MSGVGAEDSRRTHPTILVLSPPGPTPTALVAAGRLFDLWRLDDRSRLTDCIEELPRVVKVLARGADTFGSVSKEAGAYDDRHAQGAARTRRLTNGSPGGFMQPPDRPCAL